jgi:DNA helicase-2/ATP-dependent DNA helicase PcrA
MPGINSYLTLAVAGSRKTQSIVDYCAAADPSESILILTYTKANQEELRNRLAIYAGGHLNIEVKGWFSFVIANFVRPFVPFLFEERKVRGFDFDSQPQQWRSNDDQGRYFNKYDEVRKVHLPQLAVLVETASNGAGIRRLEQLYDHIFIDEVQDLCGYDLEILKLLMSSKIPLKMVGDIRQATLATNEREQKNKRFMYMNIWNWFKDQEAVGNLRIAQCCETWRCTPAIAALADSLFAAEWGFATTVSRNTARTNHDGVFLIVEADVDAYVTEFSPQPLRYSASSGRNWDRLEFINFGMAKGLGRQRVLIHPTKAISNFIQNGLALEQRQAASFYIAVTRAEQSVAIILNEPGSSLIPYWTPLNSR